MAANTPNADAFARDLGYLDKFLANLEAHAAGLPEANGTRLKALLAEEQQRWREIRGLLSGSPVAPGAAPARPVEAAVPAEAPRREGLTVGSLLGQPKK